MPDDGDIVSLGVRAEGISHPNSYCIMYPSIALYHE